MDRETFRRAIEDTAAKSQGFEGLDVLAITRAASDAYWKEMARQTSTTETKRDVSEVANDAWQTHEMEELAVRKVDGALKEPSAWLTFSLVIVLPSVLLLIIWFTSEQLGGAIGSKLFVAVIGSYAVLSGVIFGTRGSGRNDSLRTLTIMQRSRRFAPLVASFRTNHSF